MNNVRYTTSHLPKSHKWRKRIIYMLLIILIALIILYPYEFGQIVGEWVNTFKNGYNN